MRLPVNRAILAIINSDPSSETSKREELRTMAFRMREIKRLLSARVEQENRRLEAEGIAPVLTASFQEQLVPEDGLEE
ncbi:hypothetical protein G9464_16980 [Halostella sp. JP-L12]|uniref:hypothetical protein n=1 Tax=Halostella TaxID=1843185 RepID=UPI000EF7E876|nr:MULTISPECIES: hypothetical protein [Halostella]NHN49269.1 hypothetical protein [Halostella sp. JP-L12]